MILSIITVNKNNAIGLEKTIQSVICQTNKNFEYIVIDGASNDNSIDIINKYKKNINFWVSEPDTGIYNAMNKGIKYAHGKYCLFLNSADYIISSETLDKLFNEINDNQSDIFYSNLTYPNNKVFSFPDIITINYLLRQTLSHQNTLIKRSLFFEHGFYNENLILASDWEFFLIESYKFNSVFFHLKTNISIFDINGLSTKNPDICYKEEITVVKNVFGVMAESIIEYRYIISANFYKIYLILNKNIFFKYLIKLFNNLINFMK